MGAPLGPYTKRLLSFGSGLIFSAVSTVTVVGAVAIVEPMAGVALSTLACAEAVPVVTKNSKPRLSSITTDAERQRGKLLLYIVLAFSWKWNQVYSTTIPCGIFVYSLLPICPVVHRERSLFLPYFQYSLSLTLPLWVW